VKTIYYTLTLLLSLYGFVNAKMYYVATDGDNSNPGTEALPWLTPQYAANVADAGDTVIFKDGLYIIASDSSLRLSKKGSADNPIIFRAMAMHGARIHKDTTGSDATISIGVYDGANGGWQEHQEMYIVLDGLEVTGGKMHGIQSAGGGQLIIKNCKVHDTGQDPIKINNGADYTVLENNEIYNSGVIDACSLGCNSDGIDITSSDYVIVRENHVHDILSWGMYVKKGSEFAIIERNKFNDIGEGGIGIGESTVAYNTIARNNILYNINNTCLQFAGAKDSKFYNNTCYNVSIVDGDIWAGLRAVPAQHTEGAKPGDDKYSRNVEFKNNIVVINNAQGFAFRASDPTFGTGTKQENIQQLHSDNNLFFNLIGGIGYGFFFEGHIESTLPDWQAYSVSLGNAQEMSSIISDPLFESVNPGAENFLRIGKNSPARNTGAVLSSDVLTDYRSNTRVSYDIGAYEYIDGIDKTVPNSPSGLGVK